MADFRTPSFDSSFAPSIDTNKVLRSTYVVLALTIMFAAFSAFVGIVLAVPFMGFLPYIIGFFALSYVVNRTANSVWGLFWSFVFAGFIGIVMAPILSYYLDVQPVLVVHSLGLTALTFFGLSAYCLVSRRDFSWLSQFLVVSFFVVIGIIIVSFLVDLSPFQAMISGFMVFVASALILWQTSRIVLGGETNYIIAANTLFVSVYLLFMNLLSLIGFMSDD